MCFRSERAPLMGTFLSFVHDYGLFAVGKTGAADDAFGAVATSGGAMLATIGDELQMEFFPRLRWPKFFEVGFGLDDVFSVGEFPALGKAMDVRIDGEGGDFKGVDHYNAGGFMSNPWKFFQGLEVGGDLSVIFFDEHFGEAFDVAGLSVGQTAGFDAVENFFDGKFHHCLRGVGFGEESRSDDVDAFVGALRGEEYGDQQGEGVGVIEWNRDFGIEVV